ncbi:MAG: DinB family protein [Balneolaceae bacterium]|nr:DinB family protein [Balneolaceae bacterium]
MKSIPEIKDGLDHAFNEVIRYVETQPDHLFEASEAEGKWSTGQQLEHLIKSVSPVILGLSGPAILLIIKFGKVKREEMSYNELLELYHQKLREGGKSTAPYLPDPVPLSTKSEVLKTFDKKRKKLIKVIDRWTEKEISTIAAKHPLLGVLSLREVLYFTEFHTMHHLESIKKIR